MSYKPRRYTKGELKRAGVTLDPLTGNLLCAACLQNWYPVRQSIVITGVHRLQRVGGRLPLGYWICPNGCNDPAKA